MVQLCRGQTALVERRCVTGQLRERHLDGGARVRMRHEDRLCLETGEEMA
jgi:hypothetical protein